MSQSKRYYWLKMEKDFLQQKSIKALRRTAGGATYVLIYIEMMLLSVPTQGVLTYDGIYGSFEEELALELNENVEDVRFVCGYLKGVGLLGEQPDSTGYVLPDTIRRLGSKTDSAERMKKSRQTKAMKASQSDAKSAVASQSDAQRIDNREKIIENREEVVQSSALDCTQTTATKSPPTLAEVEEYIASRGNNIDAEKFYSYYSSLNWKTKNGDPVISWKTAVLNWERSEKNHKRNTKHQPSYDSKAYERKGRNGPPVYSKQQNES